MTQPTLLTELDGVAITQTTGDSENVVVTTIGIISDTDALGHTPNRLALEVNHQIEEVRGEKNIKLPQDYWM
ncbi:hypothetical protein AAKU61_003831 [Undibacterium sp. GrIS 1.2]